MPQDGQEYVNEFGQPIGAPAPKWRAALPPERITLDGRTCRVEPLARTHVTDLYDAYSAASDGRDWTYMPNDPPSTLDDYTRWAEEAARSQDPLHYAVVKQATGRAVGTLALMRQDPANGVIEVGWVTFSRSLQRTPVSTEAQYLLMRYVFDTLGYRRYEWKCDTLNAPSRRAAHRLGFEYEGTFRQAVVYKGRNRDTAWFAMLDRVWPRLKYGMEAWLDPDNFDGDGNQKQSLTLS